MTLNNLPEQLMDAVLQSLNGMSKTIQIQCLSNLIPLTTIQRLLAHDDDSIASHAAIGMWAADPKRSVPEDLRELWAAAVLRGSRREYWLGEIFKEEIDLGFAFLRKEFRNVEAFLSSHDHATREALKSISHSQRRIILNELPDDFWSCDVVRMLVADNTDLYRELLSVKRLRHHHLEPIHGRPNEGNWVAFAKVALDAGIAPKDIALAALEASSDWVNMDLESELWSSWIEAFRVIQSDDDERICKVAKEGMDIAATRRELSISEKRARETYERP